MMVRTTTGTRRLPPRAYNENQKRSPQEIAAGVAPTYRQYELAIDDCDEQTIVAFLTLAPNIQRAMDATNAFMVHRHALPAAPRRVIGESISTTQARATDRNIHHWLWRFAPHCAGGSTRLFTTAARYGLVEVIDWFFTESHDRTARLGAVLALVLPSMLLDAVRYGQGQVVETLLTSSVFAGLLTRETQQRTLDTALGIAQDAALCELLVAHGASACRVLEWEDSRCPLAWVLSSGVLAVGSDQTRRLVDALCVGEQVAAVVDLIRHHLVVVDASVLFMAVQAVTPGTVERLVTDGFVDVDARCATSGRTPLMAFAITWGPWAMQRSWDEHCAVARVLLTHCVDTTLCDPRGRTALHLAIFKSHLPCVQVLLDHNGIEAVHRDRVALEMAYDQRNANDDALHVLVALVKRGACLHIVDELRLGETEALSDVVERALSQCRPCKGCGPAVVET